MSFIKTGEGEDGILLFVFIYCLGIDILRMKLPNPIFIWKCYLCLSTSHLIVIFPSQLCLVYLSQVWPVLNLKEALVHPFHWYIV